MKTSARSDPSSSHSADDTNPADRSAPFDRSDALLLEFLREADSTCPSCGYNLRGLTRPICPECKQDLVLTVGMKQPKLGWFLIALAPGIFSGISATFLLLPIVMQPLSGNGMAPWFILLTDSFGFLSGFFAIGLARKRFRFLALPGRAQRTWAISIWGIHIAWLCFLILYGLASQ